MNPKLTDRHSNAAASQLWKLAHFIRDRISEAKSHDKFVKTAETYVRNKVEKLDYGENGQISLHQTQEYIQKTEWHWRNQHEFLQTVIQESAVFKDCAQELTKISSSAAGQSTHRLDIFSRAAMAEAMEELSDERIVAIVSVFLADINKSSVEIRVSAWAEGLWLEQEEITLPNLLVRRPGPKDIENEQLLAVATTHNWQSFCFSSAPPAIIEFNLRAPSTREAQEEVICLLDTFRLFRLGSVEPTRYEIWPKSLLNPGFTIGNAKYLASTYKYALGVGDREALQNFITRIKPLVVNSLERKERKPADLAFLRYSDAVLKGGDLESRITAAITCLEALFLKGKERSELSNKLSLRVASLLRLMGLNPLEVQGNILQAYDIRSTHIHGGQVEKEQLKDGDNLCRKVLEYARLSVLVFLQLKETSLEKDEFIGKLDRALLEPKSQEKVRNQLAAFIISK